jgi:Flp pilus assembly pilin Flp
MRAFAALWTSAAAAGRRFAEDSHAATAIEYAMIAAGVGAAVAATIFSLGSTVQTTFYDKIKDAMN